MTRPTSVTVVAWLVIVFASLTAFMLLGETALTFKDSPPQQWPLPLLGVVVTLVCGMFMLKGKNWARWLYIVWTIVFLTYAFTEVRVILLIPNALKVIVFGLILFSARANKYFTQSIS